MSQETIENKEGIAGGGAMRSVTIEWEGSFSLDYVIDKLNGKDDYGLIYGHHIVYGANSLLYIGRAESLTFSQRFSQHRSGWLSEEEGVSIRIGRVAIDDYAYDPPACSDWREVFRDAEALTIYWHSPAYNSSNIDSYNGQRLKVANRGERGDLCAEYISGRK